MLLRPSDLAFPADPARLFGRPGPVAAEVGIGNGLFVAALAASHPEWNVVGLELSPSSVTRALRLVRREALANARLYLGNARFFVRNVAAPGSLHRLFVIAVEQVADAGIGRDVGGIGAVDQEQQLGVVRPLVAGGQIDRLALAEAVLLRAMGQEAGAAEAP